MHEEEKALFDCMEDHENVFAGAYEELEDDFVLMMNGGKPALELIKDQKLIDMDKPVHENEGVIVVDTKEDKGFEHPMMIENYKEKMADVIAMLDKQEEIRKDAISKGVKPQDVEKEAKKAVNQKALDEVFASYLNKEYQDDQIGDLEGDEGVDPLAFIEGEEGEEGDEQDFYDYGDLSDGGSQIPSQKMTSNADMLEQKLMMDNHVIGEAVDEFIQDKKGWFRKLAKEHGSDIQSAAIEKGKEFLPGTALNIGKGCVPIAGELDEEGEEYKRILKEKSLALDNMYVEEADARDPDYITPDTSEDEADKWDAETILSTYSNLDNHPGIIRYKPKVKTDQKLKISLDK